MPASGAKWEKEMGAASPVINLTGATRLRFLTGSQQKAGEGFLCRQEKDKVSVKLFNFGAVL